MALRCQQLGYDSGRARKRLPVALWERATQKTDWVLVAEQLVDLRLPPSNHFEALLGKRRGEYSIRINICYRICFFWDEDDGAYELLIEDYH
jgi:proteic killer suppression protein